MCRKNAWVPTAVKANINILSCADGDKVVGSLDFTRPLLNK